MGKFKDLTIWDGEEEWIEPPKLCAVHINNPTNAPCGPCGDARQAHGEWKRRQVLAEARARKEQARLRQLEIEQCELCDETGYMDGHLCPHDTSWKEIATKGAALCRQALEQVKK
jgi:hypothetical protein